MNSTFAAIHPLVAYALAIGTLALIAWLVDKK